MMMSNTAHTLDTDGQLKMKLKEAAKSDAGNGMSGVRGAVGLAIAIAAVVVIVGWRARRRRRR